MINIAKYFGREIYWLDYRPDSTQLPDKNWVCLAIANSHPDTEAISRFLTTSISKGMIEFIGCGKFEKELYSVFDQAITNLRAKEGYKRIVSANKRYENQTLAHAFWQCFFTGDLSKIAPSENIQIACIDFDGVNRTEELTSYLKEFESGWLPSDNIKHEIWEDSAGLTTLHIALKRGNEFRKPSEQGIRLIHSFYASTHYEAMTIYYKFMNWGEYTIDLKVDEKLYEKKSHLHVLNTKRSEVFSDKLSENIGFR